MARHQPDYAAANREEREAEDREANELAGQAIAVKVMIFDVHERTGARTGVVDCPRCGGVLRWRLARPNDHVHAQCTTPKCLSFME